MLTKMSLRLLSSYLLLLTLEISGNLVVDSSSVPKVEESPSPLNVSVKALANFSCVVSEADIVAWNANDSLLNEIAGLIEKENEEIIGNSSAKRYYMAFVVESSFAVLLNNSNVTCFGINITDGASSDTSMGAKITIQDVLDPPYNISTSISSDTIIATWLPPFTLDGVPIRDYLVNMTAQNNSGIIEQHENETEKENITYPLVDQSACTVYNLSIQARSDAGLGDPSMADPVSKIDVPKKLTASQIGVQVIFTKEDILLEFTFGQDNCTGRQAKSLNATTSYSTNDSSKHVISVSASVQSVCGNISFNLSLPKSSQGNEVFTVITLINSEGATDSEPKLTALASTKRANLISSGSTFTVQCLFKTLSNAKGCYVSFKAAGNLFTEYQVNLKTENGSDVSELRSIECTKIGCTTCEIDVNDMKSNGELGVLAWSASNWALCHPSEHSSSLHSSPSVSVTTDTPVLNIPLIVSPIAAILFVLVIFLGFLCCCFCKRKTNNGTRSFNSDKKEDVPVTLKSAENLADVLKEGPDHNSTGNN